MTTWALVLILNFGTPQQSERIVGERLSWEQCFMRGAVETRNNRGSAMRCERRDMRA